MTQLRITSLKFLPPIEPGYKRSYDQCRKCGRVYFRDYIPYSLSTPILTLPCGHGVAERYRDATQPLPEQDGMRAMLEQAIAMRARSL